MSMLNSDLYTCSANGWVKVHTPTFVLELLTEFNLSVGLHRLTAQQLGTHMTALSFRLSLLGEVKRRTAVSVLLREVMTTTSR